jgi:N-acetyl-gamma-glutamyl-phosphate reductase
VHEGLFGETEMDFTDQLPLEQVDAIFICSGHGDSKKFLEANNVPERVKIIDLSQDFRDESNGFVYGLPEVNRERIKKANKLANPGCFATAIQLGILPLAAKGLIKNEIHTNGITGSTGAGVKPSSTSHFSWRNNNLSIYKAFTHQHLIEINRTIKQLQPDFTQELNFLPLRGDFARGIFVSSYTECDLSAEELTALYKEFYKDAAFTFVMDANLDLKQVVNTNKAIVHVEKHGNKVLAISAIDNLLKGASGQAVQNFNLMFGLDETCGLKLKSVAF